MSKKKFIVAALGLALTIGTAQSAFAATADASGASAKKTQHAEWKAQTAALKSELASLRAEQKTLTALIVQQHNANKAARTGLSAEAKAALKATLKSLAQQIKAERASIETVRTQKQALWMQVKAARQAGDTATGVADLEQIVTLKGQIIDAKQQIVTLQQSLQAALNGASA
ncbi:hypothetical protein [Cohnella yongneupensis]|uniref:Uncharacterized protein n=1 Tax=Cohnella yongneupensis TaxID=425006 RepID=A0ABW0QV61_9BACL